MWHRVGEAVQKLNTLCAVVTLFDNVDAASVKAKRAGQNRFASVLFIQSFLHNQSFKAEGLQSFRDPLTGTDA